MAQTGFPSISANAEVYPVIISPTVTEICILNAHKDGWIFRNAGDCPIYIKYGPYCNPVLYTQRIAINAIFSDNYGGLITGCVEAAQSGLLLVTLKI